MVFIRDHVGHSMAHTCKAAHACAVLSELAMDGKRSFLILREQPPIQGLGRLGKMTGVKSVSQVQEAAGRVQEVREDKGCLVHRLPAPVQAALEQCGDIRVGMLGGMTVHLPEHAQHGVHASIMALQIPLGRLWTGESRC